jgi:mono/diheme cytochrome c family protein
MRCCASVALALSLQTEVAFAGPPAVAVKLDITLATSIDSVAPAAPPGLPELPKAAASRGELLYTTHCISCHTTQMHWRDKRVANDWNGLKKQVRRWQDASSLAWNESDITEVSRYLNDSIYHFEQTVDPVSLFRFAPRRSP